MNIDKFTFFIFSKFDKFTRHEHHLISKYIILLYISFYLFEKFVDTSTCTCIVLSSLIIIEADIIVITVDTDKYNISGL